MKNANEEKIVKELLDLTDREFTDEELIHELISTKVTKNSEQREKLSLGQCSNPMRLRNLRKLGVHLQLHRGYGDLDGA